MMLVRNAALVMMICIALLVSFPHTSEAQDGSFARFRTELVITDLNTMDGRGSIDFYFEGEAAQMLRYGILATYDTNINQYIDLSEARAFLSRLGTDLSGRQTWGVSIEEPTNYSAAEEQAMRDATDGLLYASPTSTDPISFRFDFHADSESITKELVLSATPVDAYIDALQTVTGFEFVGEFSVRDRAVVFGLSSFTSPNLAQGHLTAVRTPVGTIVWYSLNGEITTASAPASDSIVYERFNLYENQQMAFIVLIIGCGLVLRIPVRRFDKFLMQHPKEKRKGVKPILSVRILCWSLVALLCILYSLPFIFSIAQSDFMIHSSYLYFIAPAAVLVSFVFSRVMYDLATLSIPEEESVEVRQAFLAPDKEAGELRCSICMMPIDVGLDLYECVCGFIMHMSCAERSQACPQCGEILFPEHTRSVECRTCGETFLTSGEEDPFTLQCTKCGAFQEEVKPGVNYLVVDVDPTRGYNMLRSMGLTARPAMVLTSEFPGKIRDEYDLGDDFDVKWLTESTGDIDSVNIKDLEGDAMETVSTFLMTTKRSGLLVDGLEQVISDNGFDAALAFIKRMNDLAAIHGASVILWVDRERFTDDQFKAVSDEFEEIHDYL